MLKPLADEGKIKIVVDQWHDNWSGESALKTAENAFSANNNDVDAFITSNDGMAIGIVQAVEGQGLAGKVYISGLDADLPNDRLIAKGVIDRSVWTKIDEMGARAVEAAVALAKGETPAADGTTNNGMLDVPSAFIAVSAVTKDNMCDWIKNVAPEGWVTAADVYADIEVPEGCK
jgi:D-xylose transport system substrate-binding protein